MKCYRILATLCIGEDVIVVTTYTVSNTITVPCKLLTGCYQCIGVYSFIAGLMTCYRILATLCIGKDVIVVTTYTVSNTITVPCKLLTGCYQCIGVYSVIDG